MKNGSVTEFAKSKKLRVYSNGDSHCYNFLINPRQLKGWTAILNCITEILKPICGPITRLVALSSMREIECFEDLDPKETYVALGRNDKFKHIPGGYGFTSYQEILKKEPYFRKYYTGELDSNVKPFLIETERKNLTVVYLLVNGKTCQCPLKVVLNRCDLKRCNVTKNYLSKLLDIPGGIHYIATVFGDILSDLRELQHGYPYVVVPFNKEFVDLDYLWFFSDKSGCTPVLKFNIRPTVPMHRDNYVPASGKRDNQPQGSGKRDKVEPRSREIVTRKETTEKIQKILNASKTENALAIPDVSSIVSNDFPKSNTESESKSSKEKAASIGKGCSTTIYINPCGCTENEKSEPGKSFKVKQKSEDLSRKIEDNSRSSCPNDCLKCPICTSNK